MSNVNESIVSVLECPICTEFMAAPITQCSNGHNICGECKKKINRCPSCQGFFITRNRALELIAETTNFPCENVEFGCVDTMLLSKRDQHVRQCPYRLYYCVVGKNKGCKWAGRKTEILAHVQEKHNEVAWMKGEKISVVGSLKLPKELRDSQLLQAHGEIFWFHQHYSSTDEIVYSAVQYIGPAEVAKKFTYKITFGSVLNSEKASMTCFTHTDLEDKEKILKPDKCAFVEFWKLNKLVNDGKVKFEIKIKNVSG